MSDERTIKRILLFVILPGGLLYFGMRFYAQHCHVDVYVSRYAPMPDKLAAGLHMKEHGISSVVRVDSPYESAEDKVLSREEIGKIRTKLAWSKMTPIFVDAILIQSTNRVLTKRMTRRFLEECELAKKDTEWIIKSGTRTDAKKVITFQ